MKKYVKSIAVLILLFTTTLGMANGPKISLEKGSDAKSLVFKMGSQALDSKIKLIDKNAQTIYSENVLSDDYSKKFNLKDLQVGTYYLTVENKLTSVIYKLDVDSKKVKITNKKETVEKPIFRRVGDKISVNLFNADKERVDIIISDGQDRVVQKESSKGELTIGKTFNFEKAVKGNYTIKVSDGQGTYFKNISIE